VQHEHFANRILIRRFFVILESFRLEIFVFPKLSSFSSRKFLDAKSSRSLRHLSAAAVATRL